jgi:hypothetical protein
MKILIALSSQLSVFLIDYQENLFIKATILQKQENQRKIQYARKILKLDQKVENADMNNAMINYKTFEPELYVLKSIYIY